MLWPKVVQLDDWSVEILDDSKGFINFDVAQIRVTFF